MIHSASEIETTMLKAAVASGWAHGVAEEFGCAARWIALHGTGDLASLLKLACDGPREVCVVKSSDVWEIRGDSASGAISAFDVLSAGLVGTVRLHSVSGLPGILGLAGASAAAYEMTFFFSCPGDGRELWEIRPDGGVVRGLRVDEVADVCVRAKRACGSSIEGGGHEGIQVSPSLWTRMEALAAKTYVPSNATSRRFGAGADISDNE